MNLHLLTAARNPEEREEHEKGTLRMQEQDPERKPSGL